MSYVVEQDDSLHGWVQLPGSADSYPDANAARRALREYFSDMQQKVDLGVIQMDETYTPEEFRMRCVENDKVVGGSSFLSYINPGRY